MMKFDASRHLSIIPARGGSKRVPGKNSKLLVDKPLLAWTIETVLKSQYAGQVIVSTDDQKIAQIAREYGAQIPFIREESLAGDNATTADVVIDCVERYEAAMGVSVETITLLQPTSPFRTTQTIAAAVEKFIESNGKTVVSLAPSPVPLEWMATLDSNDVVREASFGEGRSDSSLYYYTGLIYVLSRRTLHDYSDLYTEQVRGLVTNCQVECIDIDTPEDWALAEVVAQGLRSK